MRRGKARPKTSRTRRGVNTTRLDRDLRPIEDPSLEVIPVRSTLNNAVYRFSQLAGSTRYFQTATSPVFFTQYYQLSFVDQYAQFAALFDQYMIEKVEVTFYPMFRANPLATSSMLIPLIYVVCDFDDAAAPTTIQQMGDYQNCVVRSDESSFMITLTPHVALAAYNGSFTGYANQARQWLDCSSNNIPHYGIKVGIDAGASGQTALQAWNVSYRYKLAFRNVR